VPVNLFSKTHRCSLSQASAASSSSSSIYCQLHAETAATPVLPQPQPVTLECKVLALVGLLHMVHCHTALYRPNEVPTLVCGGKAAWTEAAATAAARVAVRVGVVEHMKKA
jgi:hypothetical protein